MGFCVVFYRVCYVFILSTVGLEVILIRLDNDRSYLLYCLSYKNLRVIGLKINVRCLSYRSLYQVTPLKLMTFMFGIDVSRLVRISMMPHH